VRSCGQTAREFLVARDPLRQTWIVVAAYNEAPVVGDVVAGLREYFGNVVVVDDGSLDDTACVANLAGATVLQHPINRGQGAALQTGITFALQQGAQLLVTFDADGQHDPQDAKTLLVPLRDGSAHAVLGNRFSEHADSVPAGRRLLLKLAVIFSRLTSGARLNDAHNGLRAFSREMAGHIDITLDGMAHASEIADQIHRSGLPYTERPVRIAYTDHSQQKGQNWSAAFGIAWDYLVGRVLR
jgi:polyprenyl-phospho-N-acetylgalactosaminyl synthase